MPRMAQYQSGTDVHGPLHPFEQTRDERHIARPPEADSVRQIPAGDEGPEERAIRSTTFDERQLMWAYNCRAAWQNMHSWPTRHRNPLRPGDR